MSSFANTAQPTPTKGDDPVISGFVLILLAFDMGFQIDLDAAGVLARDSTRERVVRARRPAPVWFDYKPAPLRLQTEGPSQQLAGRTTEPVAEALVYDFGGALLTYRVPLEARLSELPKIAATLYDCPDLVADGRRRLESIMSWMRPAIERPMLRELFEDYVVFSVTIAKTAEQDASLSSAELLDRKSVV